MISQQAPCIIDPGAPVSWQISEAARNVRIAVVNRDPAAQANAKRAYAGLLADLLLKQGGFAT